MIVLLAVLGFPAGILVGRLAKEELRGGKLWFRVLHYSLFIAMGVLAAFSFWYVVIPAVLLLFIKKQKFLYELFTYLLFGAVVLITEQEVLAGLLFLYGIPAGTLWYHDYKRPGSNA